jgi:hypothetical protein
MIKSKKCKVVGLELARARNGPIKCDELAVKVDGDAITAVATICPVTPSLLNLDIVNKPADPSFWRSIWMDLYHMVNRWLNE